MQKRQSFHRGYTNLKSGPERTKLVLDFMFKKLDSKNIYDRKINERNEKRKANNQLVQRVSNVIARDIKRLIQTGNDQGKNLVIQNSQNNGKSQSPKKTKLVNPIL